MGFSEDYSDLSNAISLGSAIKEANQYRSTGAIPTRQSSGMYTGPSGAIVAGGPLEPLGETNSSQNPAPSDFVSRKFTNLLYASDRPSIAKGWKFFRLNTQELTDLLLKIWISVIIVGLSAIVYLAITGRL